MQNCKPKISAFEIRGLFSPAHLQTTTESPIADCRQNVGDWADVRRAEETYAECMEEDLRDVARNGNICEICFGTSRLITVIDKRINQSLLDRGGSERVSHAWTVGLRTIKPRDT
jgi:hypothetical protein